MENTTTAIETILASVNPNRRESLEIALSLGAGVAMLSEIAAATRLARADTICLPEGRFEHLSRGKGWARKGRGDNAVWGERVNTGYRCTPGTWVIGSNDGYSRKDATTWKVRNVEVVPGTVWTIAE